jgi:hypothetical protein
MKRAIACAALTAALSTASAADDTSAAASTTRTVRRLPHRLEAARAIVSATTSTTRRNRSPAVKVQRRWAQISHTRSGRSRITRAHSRDGDLAEREKTDRPRGSSTAWPAGSSARCASPGGRQVHLVYGIVLMRRGRPMPGSRVSQRALSFLGLTATRTTTGPGVLREARLRNRPGLCQEGLCGWLPPLGLEG